MCSSDLCLKPSVGLHERLGFERGGLLPAIGFKHGCWHDVGWWRLELQTLGDFPEEPRPLAAVLSTEAWNECLARASTLPGVC